MQDLYQQVTDKIIAALEAGVAPWVKPWKANEAHGGAPYNGEQPQIEAESAAA